MSEVLPEAAAEMAPTSRLVYLYLRTTDEATQPEIAEATRTPQRTVRYVLRELEDMELVTVEPKLSDPRQSHYSTTD